MKIVLGQALALIGRRTLLNSEDDFSFSIREARAVCDDATWEVLGVIAHPTLESKISQLAAYTYHTHRVDWFWHSSSSSYILRHMILPLAPAESIP